MRRKKPVGEYKIHQICVLNENDRAAKNVLTLASREVEPIMQKRKWEIQTLEEFSLPDRRFVGLYIKSESKIKLRLRSHVGAPCLYHYDFIIGSLLHELAHIRYASHGKRFQSLLQTLKYEYNMLYCSHIETPIKLDTSVFSNDMCGSIDLDAYDIVYEIEQSGYVTPLVFIDSSKTTPTKKPRIGNVSHAPIVLTDDNSDIEVSQKKKKKSTHQETVKEVIDVEACYYYYRNAAILMGCNNTDMTKAKSKRTTEQVQENQKKKKKVKWDVPEDQIIVID